jgi:hypothetical protein
VRLIVWVATVVTYTMASDEQVNVPVSTTPP